MNKRINMNFLRAGFYSRLLRPPSTLVKETSRPDPPFPYTERHLQCVWFNGAYRPTSLTSANGEKITVENPGRWNTEAGPDFLDAAITVGPDKRKITGDVEIHVHPEDWHRHGHTGDPRYDRVAVHVTFFPERTPSLVPQSAIHIPLRDTLRSNPCFSFENIDVTAYPHAATVSPKPPCARILSSWTQTDLIRLLNSAGEERLKIKTARLRTAIAEHGDEQTLFNEIMGALGYKHNRNAMRQLAQQLPLKTIRQYTANDVVPTYALMLGVSGLIPTKIPARWDSETRVFVRELWNCWWKNQSELEYCIMPRNAWRLSGLRPQNHPLRRIAAGAALLCQTSSLAATAAALNTNEPETCLKLARKTLQENAAFPYWQKRLSLGGKPQDTNTALIGTRRVSAILTNAFIPYLAALDLDITALLDFLPPEHDNNLVRQTAFSLFGRDHNPAFYRHGLRQQGLLQIFHDFCLNEYDPCRQCRLPQALRAAKISAEE